MTYVMSDIHGLYDRYLKLIKKIDLKQKDEMYVLGDMVDIGARGIDVLFDMSVRSNVFPVLGEHEYMLLCYLKGQLDDEKTELWIRSGGKATFEAVKKLSDDDIEALCEYLEDMPLYEDIEVVGKRYVLIHSGISGFSPAKALESYKLSDFLNAETDYKQRYYDSAYLVSGHIPTFEIDSRSRGEVYLSNGHIAIDCGAVCGGRLCALRLDDLEAFYE